MIGRKLSCWFHALVDCLVEPNRDTSRRVAARADTVCSCGPPPRATRDDQVYCPLLENNKDTGYHNTYSFRPVSIAVDQNDRAHRYHWSSFIVLRLGYKTSIVLSVYAAVLRIRSANNYGR